MATKVTKIRLCIDLDPATELPTAVEICRYRLEDDANPGVRTGGSTIALTVGDLNKTAHSAGTVGELVRDIVDAARVKEGI